MPNNVCWHVKSARGRVGGGGRVGERNHLRQGGWILNGDFWLSRENCFHWACSHCRNCPLGLLQVLLLLKFQKLLRVESLFAEACITRPTLPYKAVPSWSIRHKGQCVHSGHTITRGSSHVMPNFWPRDWTVFDAHCLYLWTAKISQQYPDFVHYWRNSIKHWQVGEMRTSTRFANTLI